MQAMCRHQDTKKLWRLSVSEQLDSRTLGCWPSKLGRIGISGWHRQGSVWALTRVDRRVGLTRQGCEDLMMAMAC